MVSDFCHSVSFCEQTGRAPAKEYKGSFNVRIASDLHRDAAISAAEQGIRNVKKGSII